MALQLHGGRVVQLDIVQLAELQLLLWFSFVLQTFFTPTFSFFLDRTNVAEFPRSRNQLNYVLTTCPPDMLFIAAVGLRAEHLPHSALRRVEKEPFQGRRLLHYPFSIENTHRGGRRREDLQHFPEPLSLRLSASVHRRNASGSTGEGGPTMELRLSGVGDTPPGKGSCSVCLPGTDQAPVCIDCARTQPAM